MVPRCLFSALDGVGKLPHAARFGRVCRPSVIDRQPRPVDFCDAALSQALLFCVDRLEAVKELGNNHAGPPGDRVGAGAPDRPGTGKVHIIGLYQTQSRTGQAGGGSNAGCLTRGPPL